MFLAVLSIFLIGVTGILYLLSWLLTIYHAAGIEKYMISVVLFFIPLLMIIYQLYFRKETKKAQILLISAIALSLVTYYILQLTPESLDTMARSLSN